MAALDLIIGFVLLVLGALAFSRASRASDPAVRRREWTGTILCTVAGLIFVCLYLFSSGPASERAAETAVQEQRP